MDVTVYGSHCDFLFLFHFRCYFELKKRRAGTRLRFYFIFEWECKTKKKEKEKRTRAPHCARCDFLFYFRVYFEREKRCGNRRPAVDGPFFLEWSFRACILPRIEATQKIPNDDASPRRNQGKIASKKAEEVFNVQQSRNRNRAPALP